MLINMNEVCNLIEMDRVTIRSKMQDGIFPKIKGKCGNNQMWSLQDVRDWLKVFEWQVMNLANDGKSAWKIGRELRTSAERAQKTIDKFRNDDYEKPRPLYIDSFTRVLSVSANLTNNREI